MQVSRAGASARTPASPEPGDVGSLTPLNPVAPALVFLQANPAAVTDAGRDTYGRALRPQL